MRVRLEEALTPEQKKEVDTWSAPHHSFSDHAFPSPSHDRTIIPVGHYDKGQHEDEIGEHLAKHGMQIHDYRQGLAKDKHGRLVKIGKALGKTGGEHLLEKFTGDPARVSKASGDHVITISRHPHDVAGMTSSGHSWKNASCMNFESGSNRRYLPHDVEHGTHVAYYHHKDDVGLEKPLARIALKPFISQDGKRTILSPENRAYGNAPGSFEKTVKDWTDKHFGTDDTDTNIYTRHKKVYDDSGLKYIGGLGSLANAQKMHGEEGVRSILNANEHKITTKHLDDLVPEYFEHSVVHAHPKLEQKHVDWILHNADAEKHDLSGYHLEGIYGRILGTHKDKISKNAIDHIISLPESKVQGYTKDDFLTHPNAPDHAIRQRIINTRSTNFHNVGPQIFAHKAAADSAVHDTVTDALKKQGPGPINGAHNFNKEGLSNYASNKHLHPLDIDDLIGIAHERMDNHEIQHHPQSRGSTIGETTNFLISGLANNPSLSKEQAHKVLGLAERRAGTNYSPFEHGDALRNLANWHSYKDPVLTNRLVGHTLTGLKHVNGHIRHKAAAAIGIMHTNNALTKDHQHDILTSVKNLYKAAPAHHEYDNTAIYLTDPSFIDNLHPDVRKNIVHGVYGPLPLKRLAAHVPLTEEEQLSLPEKNIDNATLTPYLDNPLRAQIARHPVHPKTWDKLASHEDPTMRSLAASHDDLPDHHLATLLKDPNLSVKMSATQNKNIDKHLDAIVEGHDTATIAAVFKHGKDRHINRMLDRMHEDSPVAHRITATFALGFNSPDTFSWANLNPTQATKLAHAVVHHHKKGVASFSEDFIEGLRSRHGESPFYVMHNYADELSKKESPTGRENNEKELILHGLARSQHTPHEILRKLAHGPDVDVHKRLANNTWAPDDVIQHLSKHPHPMVNDRASRELKRRGVSEIKESTNTKIRVYLLG